MKVMKTPRSLELEITNRCNLRCHYCSHFTSAGDVESDLPTSEWLRFFRELGRCAVMEVILTGGEVFCREDIEELIQGIVDNRMRFSILSNGTLISEKTAAMLAATGRCEYVQVSIDSSVPAVHDAFRGNGSFFGAMEGLRNLQRYSVPVTVRVTLHRENLDTLEGVAKMLLDDLGLPSFSTNAASHMGLCRQNAARIQLTAGERSKAMTTLQELNSKFNGRINASAGPLAEAGLWTQMEQARKNGAERLPGGGTLSGCGGTWSRLTVRADGVIVPCSQMPHIELGRINQDDLAEVWQNHPELNRIRTRNKIPLTDFEFCRGCDYTSYCTGSCPALAYTIVGDDSHPSPDACLRNFLREGGTLPPAKERPEGDVVGA